MCPKPDCALVCEVPHNTTDTTVSAKAEMQPVNTSLLQFGDTSLLQLQPGEFAVKHFEAPSDLTAILERLRAGKAHGFRVAVARKPEDSNSVEMSHIELPLVGTDESY